MFHCTYSNDLWKLVQTYFCSSGNLTKQVLIKNKKDTLPLPVCVLFDRMLPAESAEERHDIQKRVSLSFPPPAIPLIYCHLIQVYVVHNPSAPRWL